MDGVTFHFLMGKDCMKKVETRMTNIVTTCLYESLDSYIFMNVEGL